MARLRKHDHSDPLEAVHDPYRARTMREGDAGYWHQEQMDELVGEHGVQVLIPPDASNRTTSRPGWNGGRYKFMRHVLQTELGRTLYRRRKAVIEPVFGHTKFNRRMDRSNAAGSPPADRNGG